MKPPQPHTNRKCILKTHLGFLLPLTYFDFGAFLKAEILANMNELLQPTRIFQNFVRLSTVWCPVINMRGRIPREAKAFMDSSTTFYHEYIRYFRKKSTATLSPPVILECTHSHRPQTYEIQTDMTHEYLQTHIFDICIHWQTPSIYPFTIAIGEDPRVHQPNNGSFVGEWERLRYNGNYDYLS